MQIYCTLYGTIVYTTQCEAFEIKLLETVKSAFWQIIFFFTAFEVVNIHISYDISL